ncbi:MAG TPA: WcaI family glycosyltransferase [Anaerolineae bacterium]|nr:WcaI family glycosyltransferase [Anaerolineae bacterium]
MNLLVIGMNYAPERTGIAPFTTELCEYLAQRGHRVTVATTFPHYPEWKTHATYSGKWALTEQRNGVTLHRKAVFLPKRASALHRILYDTTLGVGAFFSGIRDDGFDLILGIEPPIQAGAAARLLAARKRSPYVLLIQDLALEAAASVGMVREGAAMRLAQRLERWVYEGARRIIVITPSFLGNLKRKGVAESKLVYLPNWVSFHSPNGATHDSGFRAAYGIGKESLLVLHSGNMGAKQQLENVLHTAARLKNHSEITFLLVGDGSQKTALMAEAQREGLKNVQFLPLQPSDQVPDMMAAADILLLNQHPDLIEGVIPSKLLMYMAAARPIVVAAHPQSEAARQVRAANCGVWVAPNQPDALAAAIVRLAADAPSRTALGQHGRAYVEQNYAREHLVQAYEECLLDVLTGLNSPQRTQSNTR